MSLNNDLSNLFSTMAALMEIKGESTFKAIAFGKVSRLLNDMAFDIRKCYEEGGLCDLEGIGASSQRIIEEYIKTGRSTDYEELAASVPAGLIPLLAIPSMGPKTIGLLWRERNVTTMEDLVKLLDSGGMKGLKGIGEKKIEAIKAGITMRSQSAGRKGIIEALPLAEAIRAELAAGVHVEDIEVAGSLRRRRETIGDVDLVCAVDDMKNTPRVEERFRTLPEVQKVLASGPAKASVITAGGLQVDLRMIPKDRFGSALMYFTGSKEHNVKVRGRALAMGFTLNEWGLFKLDEWEKAEAKRKPGEVPPVKPVAAATEEEIYKKLGLAYVEPELRENRGEVEAAEAGKLPKLIELADIRGDLHSHTTASDGVDSIEQMAEAAGKRGYQFLAITDHSKSQAIANGLSVERLVKHAAAIRKVNDRLRGKVKLLAGSEVDILADGRLDYEDAVLAELDYVVASPHFALTQDEAKATDRLLRAVDSRYVNVIGHPTGRLIDRRAGLPVRFEPVFKAAAANGTAMEINSSYPRFDLNEVNARAGIESGVMLSINTDAHSTAELDLIAYGVNVARRAWATKKNVINCMTWDELKKFIGRKRA
jgi:DNA polymerase (family 10)